ncbi:unnamed protein product [Mycena citricolor]|uniref:GST C-terminal domain-containing protein n=1 Tax=Mycena citricolor TaxID=2018698 RepID=A0AAD2HF43_9AGAR|nr:unnamed protein product [Mycena citricolor]
MHRVEKPGSGILSRPCLSYYTGKFYELSSWRKALISAGSYDASPFSVKVDHILLLKGIHHATVNVASILPRPEITDLLGLNYRRIPILAIGNDIYIDTSLISVALERRFPVAQGFGTLFPKGKQGQPPHTGLIKAFAKHWADTVLFSLAPALLNWSKFPAAFVKDRSALSGAPINVQAITASREKAISLLSTQLSLVEEQLSDGREWLFDSEGPSLADVSVNFVYAWVQTFRGVESLFDPSTFPKSLAWLSRMAAYLGHLKKVQPQSAVISGADAAAKIASESFEAYSVVGFDQREAKRLGLTVGDRVSVAPDDSGRNFPTEGTLVALNREELILEVQGQVGTFRCHFPRVMFTAKVVSKSEHKLVSLHHLLLFYDMSLLVHAYKLRPISKEATELAMRIITAHPSGLNTREIFKLGLKAHPPVEHAPEPTLPFRSRSGRIGLPVPTAIDHPFRSVRYLKSRILDDLEKQQAIQKRLVPVPVTELEGEELKRVLGSGAQSQGVDGITQVRVHRWVLPLPERAPPPHRDLSHSTWQKETK